MSEVYLYYDLAVSRFGREKVNAALDSIIKKTEKDNQEISKMQLIQGSTEKRLSRLKEQNLNLEYMALGGQLVEKGVKRLINTYAFVIESSLILVDFDTKLKTTPAVNDLTLGSLIKELKRYCKEDSLLNMLDDFNNKRNKSVHKVYEQFEDIEIVNESIKNYVSTDPVVKLSREMASLHGHFVKDLINKLKLHGCEVVPVV